MLKRKKTNVRTNTEICRNCGCSVKLGSGNFVNRVPSCDDEETHRENGDPFPEGMYLCAQCDHEIYDNCSKDV